MYAISIIKQFFSTGQFCSQKEITYFKDFKTFSLQPKLISLALFLLILLGILYFYHTSNRMTKSHKIPRYRQTLITLKEHSIILALFLVVLLVDETVFAFMELLYSSHGPSGAFRIWWTQTLFGYFVLNIVIPALCLRCAKNSNIFNNLLSAVFPDFYLWRYIEYVDFQEQFEGLAGVPGLGRLHFSWTANDQACTFL